MPFLNQVATPTKATSGAETRETCLESGERRPERQDQPGGEDAPGPTRKMEALVKVVSQLHKQWGIDCKPKDFTLAVARLLQIKVIDQPVDILHPEVWDKCTKAVAEETMSSGCGKNLKSWGKVAQALQKAIQEQETWMAARDCLLVTPKVGVGAATQTLHPLDDDDFAESKDPREGDTFSQSPNPDPLTEGQKRAKSFWGGLIEEARGAAEIPESEKVWARPPPYAPQDGAEQKGEGRSEDALGGNREETLEQRSACKRKGEGGTGEGRRASLKDLKNAPDRGRGEPKGRERPARKGSGRGRSPTKRYRSPEVTIQSSSDPESDTSWDEWPVTDSNSEEEEMRSDKAKSQHIPTQFKEKPRGGQTLLTDWRKITMACAGWAPSAALAFPVRVTEGGQRVHSPINPKDVQAIVKAIADKGLNSAMVSTLIDGIFGGGDMLPFDIKQTCRLIFGGAGMIVFKQEWEENCARQLAQVTGADHPLHGSSLQRLMGTDPTMITPQAQAQGLRAHEVMTTTRAAREAIRTASTIIAKPTPWSAIKQNESESFTQFVDRLQAAVDSSTLPAEAKGPVVADCLRQQCNSATKEILRSLPAGASIADMIKHVVKEEHLAPIQVAVSTAIANVMACFKCGQTGHVVANCPQQGDLSTAPPPRQSRPRGPCWACGKKGHFAKECRSKIQGNGRGRGQLGRARPSPTWDMRRPNYANPGFGEVLPNPLPPREATNFMVQPTVQSSLSLSQGQQGPPLGGETPGWPWQ